MHMKLRREDQAGHKDGKTGSADMDVNLVGIGNPGKDGSERGPVSKLKAGEYPQSADGTDKLLQNYLI